MSKKFVIELGHNCTIGGSANRRSVELLSCLVEMRIGKSR